MVLECITAWASRVEFVLLPAPALFKLPGMRHDDNDGRRARDGWGSDDLRSLSFSGCRFRSSSLCLR